MPNVQPDSENFRKATQWLLEERRYNPQTPLAKLIETACLKFDLSPLEADFLGRFVEDEKL
jgi:hypothetical protein